MHFFENFAKIRISLKIPRVHSITEISRMIKILQSLFDVLRKKAIVRNGSAERCNEIYLAGYFEATVLTSRNISSRERYVSRGGEGWQETCLQLLVMM